MADTEVEKSDLSAKVSLAPPGGPADLHRAARHRESCRGSSGPDRGCVYGFRRAREPVMEEREEAGVWGL